VELIGALALTSHACLLIACVDHVRWIPLIKLAIKVSKFSLCFYAFLVILRTILYLVVHSDVLNHDRLKHD
jgi:hypothetical protein